MASSTPTSATTCATARWRRSPCGTRSTPRPTCRPRSRSRRSTATPTSSCSWPRAAARPTRATCSRRPRRCSTRRAWPGSSTRSCARSAPPPARRTTWPWSSAARRPSSRSRPPSWPRPATSTRCPPRAASSATASATVELEAEVLAQVQQFGIGAQFGGKYFCHDVRVIRLPRHGASCPVGIAVSCSADRQALAKITHDGVFLEQLEHDPARFLPEVDETALGRRRRADRPVTARWTRSAPS